MSLRDKAMLGLGGVSLEGAAFQKFKVGDRVVITDKTGFYAYVDGWRGMCGGYDQGYVVVIVNQEEEGGTVQKRFLVPQLEVEFSL